MTREVTGVKRLDRADSSDHVLIGSCSTISLLWLAKKQLLRNSSQVFAITSVKGNGQHPSTSKNLSLMPGFIRALKNFQKTLGPAVSSIVLARWIPVRSFHCCSKSSKDIH